jgi:hypothetical protein
MLKYIILLVIAIIVFPIVIYIVRRRNLGNWIILGTLTGLFISIMGLVMEQTFSPLFVLIAMFGLAFAVSVLLDKRTKQNGAVKFKNKWEEDKVPAIVGAYQDSGIKKTAASLEEDGSIIKAIDDDLNRWMTADNQGEVHDSKGSSDGK